MKTITGLNNIPTEEQNYICTHWPETRRSLEILGHLLEGAAEETAAIIARGDAALRRLQKGQLSRRRPLMSHGPHTGHH